MTIQQISSYAVPKFAYSKKKEWKTISLTIMSFHFVTIRDGFVTKFCLTTIQCKWTYSNKDCSRHENDELTVSHLYKRNHTNDMQLVAVEKCIKRFYYKNWSLTIHHGLSKCSCFFLQIAYEMQAFFHMSID